MTFFDVRIPGLKMTVVAADGQDVEPVPVDEFRIGVAETYDVIVEPQDDRAYTVFAQSIDRTGYARGTLAPRAGMQAEVPRAGSAPARWRMVDMMGAMAHGGMAAWRGHGMRRWHGMDHGRRHAGHAMTCASRRPVHHARTEYGPGVDMRVDMPRTNLDDPGVGLRDNGRRVLTYADLHTSAVRSTPRDPAREIELHLTGNMERYIWSFDGVKFCRRHAGAFPPRRAAAHRAGQRHHDDHPIHLHGMWSELENPEGRFQVRKHTINVQPAQRVSYRGHRRRARPLGLSLPPALSHGSGHVPRGGGVMSARVSDDAHPLPAVAASCCAGASPPWRCAERRRMRSVVSTVTMAMGAMPGMDHGSMPACAPAMPRRHRRLAAPVTHGVGKPGMRATPAMPHGMAQRHARSRPRCRRMDHAGDVRHGDGRDAGRQRTAGRAQPRLFRRRAATGRCMPGMDMATARRWACCCSISSRQFHGRRRQRPGVGGAGLVRQRRGQAVAAQRRRAQRRHGSRTATSRRCGTTPSPPTGTASSGCATTSAQGPRATGSRFGVQGLAPYWFELEATGYVGPSGRTAARLRADYELLFTQRLILQPELELNLYGKDDPARGIGSGLSDVQFGLRLRYEIRREFAPYVGVQLGAPVRYHRRLRPGRTGGPFSTGSSSPASASGSEERHT